MPIFDFCHSAYRGCRPLIVEIERQAIVAPTPHTMTRARQLFMRGENGRRRLITEAPGRRGAYAVSTPAKRECVWTPALIPRATIIAPPYESPTSRHAADIRHRAAIIFTDDAMSMSALRRYASG